jgi:hypothetical protein
MSWFSFNTKEREYNISIRSIAKEFGISISVIHNLLRDAGYNPLLLEFTMLNNKHLEVILLAYTHSIKSLYKEASNNYSKYTLKEQEELRDFFGKFIRKSFFMPEVEIRINDRILPARNGKIYKSDLDNELISEYFFKRIKHLEIEQEIASYQFDSYLDLHDLYASAVTVDLARPSFIYRQLKWRTKVKHTFTDIKSRIFTTIITGHYYIFSAEEDSYAALLPSITRCFSAVQQTLGEALNINNSKFTPKWKITYIPL